MLEQKEQWKHLYRGIVPKSIMSISVPFLFQESQSCQQGPSLVLTQSVMEEPAMWSKWLDADPREELGF